MNANLKTTSNEFLDNAKANGFDFQLNFKYGKHPTFDSSDKEYVYRHNGNMISVKDINCNMYLSLDYNALNTSIFYDDLLLTTKEVDAINNLKFGDSISKLYENLLSIRLRQSQKYTMLMIISETQNTVCTPV